MVIFWKPWDATAALAPCVLFLLFIENLLCASSCARDNHGSWHHTEDLGCNDHLCWDLNLVQASEKSPQVT